MVGDCPGHLMTATDRQRSSPGGELGSKREFILIVPLRLISCLPTSSPGLSQSARRERANARRPVEWTKQGSRQIFESKRLFRVSSVSSVSSACVSSGRTGHRGSRFVGLRLPATPPPLRRLAVGLGGDLLELATLHRRQGLTGRALLGIAEGAAVGLDPLDDRFDELAFPFGQGDAGLVGGPTGALQGVDGGALGSLALGLERAGRSLVSRPAAVEAGRAGERLAGLGTPGYGRPLQG